MSKFKEAWDNITLSMLFAFLAAIAVALVIGWWSICYSSDRLLPLMALTAALVGWLVAMIATPYSEIEKRHFSEFARVVSGIITGFLLAKLGPLIDAFVAVPEHGGQAPIADPLALQRLLITLASFLLSFLFVFSGRLYWNWLEDRQAKEAATTQSSPPESPSPPAP